MARTLLEIARDMVKGAKNVVFLGGAGVSTSSGIPDFRSPKGLYNIQSRYGVPYEVMLSHSFFEVHPETFYDFYWSTMVSKGAKPNKAHLALADFEKKGRRITIITQNIDGLHQDAGSKNVLEAHGTVREYGCVRCGYECGLERIETIGVPHCPCCGGMMKPKVVLYEEPLDQTTLSNAILAVRNADLLIIGGTSMKVYPVASLPEYAIGAKKIIINMESTGYDECCDIVIHGDVDDALGFMLGD